MLNETFQLKPKISTKKLVILFFLVAIFFMYSCGITNKTSSTVNKIENWKHVKSENSDTPTWSIYMRKIEETNFLEYRIEGLIESDPSTCISAYKKEIYDLAEGKTKDLDYDFTTYNILYEAEDSIVTYVIHNEPFPFKSTEMSVRYVFYSKMDGSKGVNWNEAWNEYPIQPSKKLSRVSTFRGSWNFLSESENRSKAVNTVQFDLQGFPLWLAEPMVIKFLKVGMEDLREMTNK
jgi:hypothetical protein